jgi:hypothetical protein
MIGERASALAEKVSPKSIAADIDVAAGRDRFAVGLNLGTIGPILRRRVPAS